LTLASIVVHLLVESYYGAHVDATQETSEFPMTVWPGTVLPVPPILVPQVRRVSSDVDESNAVELLVFGTAQGAWEEVSVVTVPPELYLHEFMDLDTSDQGAVLAFCQQYGPVGAQDRADLPPDVRLTGLSNKRCVLPRLWDFVHDHIAGRGIILTQASEQFDSSELRSLQQARLSREQTIDFEYAQEEGGDPYAFAQLNQIWAAHRASQVAVYQDCLHNLVSLWRYFAEGWSREELQSHWRGSEWDFDLFVKVPEHALRHGLNNALSPFHVRLEDPQEPPSLSQIDLNIYQAMCLQLANHIAEHATYHRCANETCGRLFVRQRGGSEIARTRGAEHGQYHTSGVLYCSPQCARAQAARMVRRRKRQAAEAAKTGKSTTA
jgi:hypothetical protein